MLDEDPNIGTEEPTTTEEPSSPPVETQETPQEAPETTETTETTETPVKETIGAAMEAFAKAKNETQFTPPAAANAPHQPKPRDYSNLPPELVPVFKKMGGQAFDTFKPIYLEHQQLKKDYEALKATTEQSSKASFYEHEEAYQLSPDYKHLTANSNMLDAEISHWQQQLVNIREGKKWQPIVLDAKGNPVLGAEEDASPRAEATIINGLNQAHILKTDVGNKLHTLQSSFSSQHKGYLTGLAAVEKKVFEGADMAVLDKAMATKLPLFPQYLHNRPEIRALAKALAVIDGMAIMLQDRQTAATTNTLKARTALNGGPKGGEIQPGGGKATTAGAIMDEFKQARMAGVA